MSKLDPRAANAPNAHWNDRLEARLRGVRAAVDAHADATSRWDWEYGLRVDDREYASGEILPPSVRLGDDGEDDEVLKGTSAIAIGDAERLHVFRARRLTAASVRGRTFLTLLVARRYDEGEDPEEGVFRNATVVEQWRL